MMFNDEAIINRRFTMIADILPVINDKKLRCSQINKAASLYGVSKPTIRKYLKLYQEGGKDALVPNRGRGTTISEKSSTEKSTRFFKDIEVKDLLILNLYLIPKITKT